MIVITDYCMNHTRLVDSGPDLLTELKIEIKLLKTTFDSLRILDDFRLAELIGLWSYF